MRIFKLNFAAIIFAFFVLTSCQKETISELNPTTETTTERDIPAEGIHIYNADAKTSATTRTMATKATSRERVFTTIAPDAGPIYDDTKGEGNFIDKTWGTCLADYSYTFAGEDNVYIFEVKDQPAAIVTHHVSITDLTGDVDLFVYTLDENNYVRDCKAISMNGGTTAESVDMQGLGAGFYIIVVDGWAAGVTSSYNMEFYTTAISANPPSEVISSTLSKVSYGQIFADGSFQDKGYFAKTDYVDTETGATIWREHNSENDLPHFGEDTSKDHFFTVTSTDSKGNLYLRDDSRGINIELNIERKKVVYSDDQGHEFDLYDIIQAN